MVVELIDSSGIKALTLLDIGGNNIGKEGAQNLAEMLGENMVRQKDTL